MKLELSIAENMQTGESGKCVSKTATKVCQCSNTMDRSGTCLTGWLSGLTEVSLVHSHGQTMQDKFLCIFLRLMLDIGKVIHRNVLQIGIVIILLIPIKTMFHDGEWSSGCHNRRKINLRRISSFPPLWEKHTPFLPHRNMQTSLLYDFPSALRNTLSTRRGAGRCYLCIFESATSTFTVSLWRPKWMNIRALEIQHWYYRMSCLIHFLWPRIIAFSFKQL